MLVKVRSIPYMGIFLNIEWQFSINIHYDVCITGSLSCFAGSMCSCYNGTYMAFFSCNTMNTSRVSCIISSEGVQIWYETSPTRWA